MQVSEEDKEVILTGTDTAMNKLGIGHVVNNKRKAAKAVETADVKAAEAAGNPIGRQGNSGVTVTTQSISRADRIIAMWRTVLSPDHSCFNVCSPECRHSVHRPPTGEPVAYHVFVPAEYDKLLRGELDAYVRTKKIVIYTMLYRRPFSAVFYYTDPDDEEHIDQEYVRAQRAHVAALARCHEQPELQVRAETMRTQTTPIDLNYYGPKDGWDDFKHHYRMFPNTGEEVVVHEASTVRSIWQSITGAPIAATTTVRGKLRQVSNRRSSP